MNAKVLIILLLIMSVVAAQCSLGGSPTATVPTSPEAKPSPTKKPKGLAGELHLVGSDTIKPIAEQMGAVFKKLHPGVTITVEGGGSGVGVNSVGQGDVDIGNTSREITGAEFKKFPFLQVFTIGYDGLAIVTCPTVKLPGLTTQQARDIFAGEITNFSEVEGPDAEIVTVAGEAGTGTRGTIEDMVMTYREGGTKKQKKMVVGITVKEGEDAAQVIASTPNSIGIVSLIDLQENLDLNPVPLDGVQPNAERILDGSYPIARPLSMVTAGAPSGLAQAFLDFARSEEGQAIVAEKNIPVGQLKAPAAYLYIAGSSSMQPTVQKLVEAYTKLHPDVAVKVQVGGSTLGLTVAAEGGADIGNVSRAVTEADRQQFPDLKEYLIGYDGLALVTNPVVRLPAQGLTTQQVRDIFAGEITNYSQVGGPDAPIVLVSYAPGTEPLSPIQDMVMTYREGEEEKQKPIAATGTLPLNSAEVKKIVNETRNAIGFVSIGQLDNSVNAVKLDGVEPTHANVLAGRYRLFLEINMVTAGIPSGRALEFLNFARSKEGQAIVGEAFTLAPASDASAAKLPATPAPPTETPLPPTATPVLSATTSVSATATSVPPGETPTGTAAPLTETPVVSATTSVPATATSVPPGETPTGTAVPLTETPVVSATTAVSATATPETPAGTPTSTK